MRTSRGLWPLVVALALSAGAACSGQFSGSDDLSPALSEAPPEDEEPTTEGNLPDDSSILDERVVDYSEALRTASLKLVDLTPTLTQIKRVAAAADPRSEYEALIDELIADPRFARRMIRWWRDTFRQGGGALDTAPVFAARLLAEGRSYTELFTAAQNTCPSYDAEAESFVDGDCDNGVTIHAGVLTNPGVMEQFYGNMAFRRARWVQEIFACNKFPAEQSSDPVDLGDGAIYSAPWPFEALPTEPIDFQDTSSVVCANCHATMNRIAPLFGNFDEQGAWQDSIQVMTPTAPDATTTELAHWLLPGEPTAWRIGVEVADLPAFGVALAQDPDVTACMAARLWNFAMSKEDIVSGMATVPNSVIAAYVEQLAVGGNMKAVLTAIMKSEDFVSF